MDKEYWGARWGEVPKRAGDTREPSERDLARIIHSPAFRRLQGKTQVLGLGENDFYRTRLTHSIEVAQIAASVVRHHHRSDISPQNLKELLPDASHITAISLFHDVGHPPFGHGGELALNRAMNKYGGFEGNAQTLRICTKLGDTYSQQAGLALSRRTLLGVLKYPSSYSMVCDNEFINRKLHEFKESHGVIEDYSSANIDYDLWRPAKCFYDSEKDVVEWILKGLNADDKARFMATDSDFKPDEPSHKKTRHKSLDASIMDIADDISYGVHDLEDAIHLGLVSFEDWESYVKEAYNNIPENEKNEFDLYNIEDKLFREARKWETKNAVSSMVNFFINSSKYIDEEFSDPILRYRIILDGPSQDFLKSIKKLVKEKVINSASVQTLEFRGLQIVTRIFQVLQEHPDRLLNEQTREKYEKASGDHAKMRVISDHVAGMTDDYATKLYERLFVPRRGSLFEKI